MSYFNVRVYGLLINNKNQLLLSDEKESGLKFTKFPGGGVELGEGIIHALEREFIEECFCEIRVLKHFYTTDFYVKSEFNDSQVLSIYYFVEEKTSLNVEIKTSPFDFDTDADPNQAFRWVTLDDLNEEMVTFMTDKKVVSLLKERILESSPLF